MTREEAIQEIIKENERRNAIVYAKFDPISGEGSIGERKKVVIDDFPISVQWLPVEMMRVPLVRQLVKCGSIRSFLTDNLEVDVMAGYVKDGKVYDLNDNEIGTYSEDDINSILDKGTMQVYNYKKINDNYKLTSVGVK